MPMTDVYPTNERKKNRRLASELRIEILGSRMDRFQARVESSRVSITAPANKRIHNQTFYSVNDNCVSTVDPRNKVMENSRNRLEGLN